MKIANVAFACLLALTGARLAAEEIAPGVKCWPLKVPSGGKPGFTLMESAVTGVAFTNELAFEAEAANNNLLNGSGLALGDSDGDGWCDIFLCSLTGSSRLYRNLGNWKFQDVTEAAGLANTNMLARGAVFADVNGDGHLDLLVTYSGKGAKLFLNDGKGHFRDAQAEALVDTTGSMSMALGDMNGDGSLDLYVANYGENTVRSGMKVATRMVGGKEQIIGRNRNRLKIIDGRLVEYGEPGAFYLNDGKGRFTKQSWTDGTFRDESGAPLAEVPWDLAFTVVIRDINQDGNPDIYVCDDFQDPDRFWLGDGKGGFRAIAREAIRSTPHFSMSADFADVDGDGRDDFFVTDMISRFHDLRMRQLKPESPIIAWTRERAWDRPQIRRNFLFLNRGDGTYADIANYAGVASSDWSWSTVFLDVDLDGRPDILVGTGHYYDTQDLDGMEGLKRLSPAEKNDGKKIISLYPRLLTPNYAFHNLGGFKFEETGKAWGFDSVQVSHSIALADLDNDGDLDVVVNCLRAPALIYRNNCPAPRVAVRLKGTPPNTFGIGARLTLLGGAVAAQSQEMTCGSRFVAGDAPLRTFAAGDGDDRMTLEVTWRTGKRSVVKIVKANCLYEIDEAAAGPPGPPTPAPTPVPLFEDATASLGHRHVDPPYDDFNRQKLLPRRLSQLGPGIAWFDLNGDGREDLIIGAGRGAGLGVFLNEGAGRWRRQDGPWTNALPDDSAGIVGGVLKAGTRTLLAGLAHYETEQTNLPIALRIDCSGTKADSAPSLPPAGASTGPVLLADVDGDGSLDVFAGGRLQAGRYPEPVDSRLYLNKEGQLVPDEQANALLAKVGLVTGAVFTDLDGDGYPDLVLACEWGGVRVLRNDHGRFRNWELPLVTSKKGPTFPAGVSNLSQLHGLWTCVVTGDFDGDGQMDIVLGSWGLNSTYQITAPGPWFLYYGDFNEDGEVHMLEACRDAQLNAVVPTRDMLLNETDLPWIRARFPTHKAYAEATLAQILGDRAGKARVLESDFLGSLVLLNRGGQFEPRLLPPEAQWSPVEGIAVGDLDGDGKEDLLLSQNFFAVRIEDGRLDSGRGLVLKGDGQGNFSAMSGQASGIKVYGEQRGCALADYDGDGRVDAVVTQNSDQTRLFHNATGKPGLRVRLAGPAGNPDGIGAVLRLGYGERLGPAREVQAGSGFWSQNSSTEVLALSGAPTAIQVRWPEGKTTRSSLTQPAREVQVAPDGSLKVLR
ncbi:MAG TPA: CRTAC1 family protein [Verrucomicrobiae bacterium]